MNQFELNDGAQHDGAPNEEVCPLSGIRKAKSKRQRKRFWVTPTQGGPFEIALLGRQLWMLERLIVAGRAGVTTLSEPAPRVSGYVYCLRALGVEIETIWERHRGPYPGRHGRLVLLSSVLRLPEEGA